MRRTTLLQEYYELRESGSTSDFPALLGNLMYRSMQNWVRAVPAEWRNYTTTGSLPDFRPQTRVLGYESEDLLPVTEEGVYQDSKLADAQYQVQVGTYGRAFSINRQVIINDDLGYIRLQPQRFGRSAARSLSKFVAQTLLEGNGNTFDGNPLFSAAHGNLGTGAGSAFSADNLRTAITAMANQTVLGTFTPIRAKTLVIPPGLEWEARQLLNSSIILAAGGDASAGAAPTFVGNMNTLQGQVGIVVEPFLTSTTAWYVIADPADVPIIEVVFLRGKQTPDLLVERPVMTNAVGAGDDPYEFEFDTLRYKVRYDYGGATTLWWGGYKFNGA